MTPTEALEIICRAAIAWSLNETQEQAERIKQAVILLNLEAEERAT